MDGSERVHTDVNLRLEFDAPRRLFAGPVDPEKSPARAVLEAAGVSLAVANLLQTSGPNSDLLLALKYQTSVFSRNGLGRLSKPRARYAHQEGQGQGGA